MKKNNSKIYKKYYTSILNWNLKKSPIIVKKFLLNNYRTFMKKFLNLFLALVILLMLTNYACSKYDYNTTSNTNENNIIKDKYREIFEKKLWDKISKLGKEKINILISKIDILIYKYKWESSKSKLVTILNVLKELITEYNLKNNTANITIDSSVQLGNMPEAFSPGIWIDRPGNDSYMVNRFFQDNKVWKIQTQISSESLRKSSDLDDYKIKLNTELENDKAVLNLIKNSKQTLFIGQWPGAMPEWLSSRAGDNRPFSNDSWKTVNLFSPPKCYGYVCKKMEEITCYTDECIKISKKQLEKNGYISWWASVIDLTLRAIEKNWITNLSYYHGHEQNKDWFWTEEDFYKTYEYTVNATKKVDEKILVGGPGIWSWDAKRIECSKDFFNETGLSLCKSIKGWSMNGEQCKDNSENSSCHTMIENFLIYSNMHNLKVDFINFHMFGQAPEKKEYEIITGEIKGWLKKNWFSESTPIYIADWTGWTGKYPVDYLDTESMSAYFVNSIFKMADAWIKWHSYDFDIRGWGIEKNTIDQRGTDSQFIGDWSVFTRNQIIKPIYNAFRIVSLLNEGTPKKIKTTYNSSENTFLDAISSYSKDKAVKTLVSNFAPVDIELQKQNAINWLKTCLHEKNMDYIINNIKKLIASGSKFEKPADIKNIDLTSLNISSEEKDYINTCISTETTNWKNISNAVKTITNVHLNFQNIPFSWKAKLVTYTIDSSHANSCSFNKSTEEKVTNTQCGINGFVDKFVKKAKEGIKTSSDMKTLQDEINNNPNISLEWSKTEETIYIKNGKYEKDIALEINGVSLIEIINN